MHLRRLIVLIINARNVISAHPSCRMDASIVGIVYPPHRCSGLIGQIKLTRFHVAVLALARGARSNGTKGNLYTMSKDPHPPAQRPTRCKLALLISHALNSAAALLPRSKTSQGKSLVEPDGIEPTTSCLQSRRSPS
jgi:hypothetical protein